MNTIPIILASNSPRRKELLELMGIPFTIQSSTINETITKTKPEEVVIQLSSQKAIDVANTCNQDNSILIGADTIVWDNHRILGKPKDESEAFRMIQDLQGNSHFVYTGVTIVETFQKKQTITSFYEVTKVSFFPMTEKEIKAYVQTAQWDANQKEMIYPWKDKAGGYGIQTSFGTKYIKGIEGDYYNVVGLPVSALYQKLKEMNRGIV